MRTAYRGPLQQTAVHDAGLQPPRDQTQDDRISDTELDHPTQPPVVDAVEVSSDVRFVDVHHLAGDELTPERSQRLVLATSRAKPVGTIQEVCLVDRTEDPSHSSLQHPILYRGNPKGPRPSPRLWYLDSPNRRRPVRTRPKLSIQRVDALFEMSFKLLCRLSIHSARPPPVHLSPSFQEKLGRQQMRQRSKAKLRIRLRFRRYPVQSCCHPASASACRGCVPAQENHSARRFTLYVAFPRSEYYQRVRLPSPRLRPFGFPFGRHTR